MKPTKKTNKMSSMNRHIQEILGNSYSWDDENNELNYLGNPLVFWATKYEESGVKQAKKKCQNK